MEKCVSGKRGYVSKELAEEALIEAHTHFNYPPDRGPVAVYICEDCGNYHLTSQGPMNKKLAESLEDGKIKLQKEAHHWVSKFKRR